MKDLSPKTKPWRRLLFCGLLGIILAGVSIMLAAGQKLHPIAAPPAPTSLHSEISTSTDGRTPVVVCLGAVDARDGVVSLAPTTSGRVIAVKVQENDVVSAGQLLVQMDDRLARGQLQEAEAALESAEAQLAEARKAPRQHQFVVKQQQAALAATQHELAAARRTAAHKQQLFQAKQLGLELAEAANELVKKLAALEQVEQAKLEALALRDPTREAAKAEADVHGRRAILARARASLDDCQLKAPSAGIALRVLVNPGEVIGPQSRRAAIEFCPEGLRVVRAEVEQEYAGRVALGQQARIEDAASSGGPSWRGKVIRIADWFSHRRTIAPDMLPVHEVRTLECLVELEPDQPPLRIGQRVRVRLFAADSATK